MCWGGSIHVIPEYSSFGEALTSLTQFINSAEFVRASFQRKLSQHTWRDNWSPQVRVNAGCRSHCERDEEPLNPRGKSWTIDMFKLIKKKYSYSYLLWIQFTLPVTLTTNLWTSIQKHHSSDVLTSIMHRHENLIDYNLNFNRWFQRNSGWVTEMSWCCLWKVWRRTLDISDFIKLSRVKPSSDQRFTRRNCFRMLQGKLQKRLGKTKTCQQVKMAVLYMEERESQVFGVVCF